MREPTASDPKNPTSAPDFQGVETWVFDLDHTLYTFNEAEQADMEERICRYVQSHFNLPRDEAWEIQKRFLKEYGSTLAGLIVTERIDPDVYHDFVNDIDAVTLAPDAALRAGLERLPGKLLVFTNNCGRFARNVLERLGVDDLFTGVVDAKAMDFIPKPQRPAYDALLRHGRFDPTRAALFDDSPRNLVPARALGMKTVWFNDGLGQSHWRIEEPEKHIDHQTDNLAAFLNTIRI